MKPLLVIGKSGQLARALAAVGGPDVICCGRPQADLLDAVSLARTIDAVQPVAVINTGAYTSVDGAESEPDAAYALNVSGPAQLAAICAERQLPLVHLSTDCVFDGSKQGFYKPDDLPNPIGIYGRTKLEGEQAVNDAAEHSVIVRVSWIFSEFGHNFVRTMLNLAQSRSSVTVVSDQVGCPTYAPALAQNLIEIARQVAAQNFTVWGTYHLAGAGQTSRAEMARKIFEISAQYGGPVAEVVSVPTSDYPTPAQRPLNARLDISDTGRVFGIDLPCWEIGLEETVRILVEEMSKL